jgi:hypothetical protein
MTYAPAFGAVARDYVNAGKTMRRYDQFWRSVGASCIEDDSFYRVEGYDVKHGRENSAEYSDYNSTSEYNSILNADILTAMTAQNNTGLDAVTIIWIAEHFTEEHRAAIDWLNRITDKEFNFFGVEIELIKIGDSPAAPMFNVIAKPNGWSKDVRSSQTSSEGRSEGEIFKYEYWSAFVEYMNSHPSKLFRTQSPSHDHWMNIAIGKSAMHIALLVNTREQKATIQLYIWDDAEKKYFDVLVNYKDDAEASIGQKLTWRRLDGKKASTIDLYKKCDLTSASGQEEIFAWYREYTEKFISFFKPIIKKL